MSRPDRRRHGSFLATVLAFQAIAMPLGACGQGHASGHSEENAETSRESTHATGERAPHGAHQDERSDSDPLGWDHGLPDSHDSSSSDCAALAGCGSAVTLAQAEEPAEAGPDTSPPGPRLYGETSPVDLGIATPPPKI
jgi:hypothetical protein